MARALIKINGADGSNDDLPINTLVQLDNDGNGGELTYAWSILDQPEGSADALSATNIHNPTLTPKKEGTYLLQLVVNATLPSEATQTAIVGIRQLKSGQRVPAAQETVEDGATGWKNAANRNLQALDGVQADANRIVAESFGGAVANKICMITGFTTIKSGLPGQEDVPTLAAAGGGGHGPLAIIEAAVRGGSPSSTLVYARVFGLVPGTFTGDPSVGDKVYVDAATSLPTLTPSSQIAGYVVEHDGVGHTYRWVIDGHVNGGGTGTVTSVATGTGLTGGPITGSGTVAIGNTAVTPGSYTNPNLTINQQGQITAASNGSGGPPTVSQAATYYNDFYNDITDISFHVNGSAGVYADDPQTYGLPPNVAGLLVLDTGANGPPSAGSAATVTLTDATDGIVLGHGIFDLTWRAAVTMTLAGAPNGAADYTINIGANPGGINQPGLTFAAGIAASGNTHWWAQVVAGLGNPPNVDTGVAVVANGMHTFRIVYDSTLGTPSAKFYIDGALVATITTSLPVNLTVERITAIENSTGVANTPKWLVDLVDMTYTFATPR